MREWGYRGIHVLVNWAGMNEAQFLDPKELNLDSCLTVVVSQRTTSYVSYHSLLILFTQKRF